MADVAEPLQFAFRVARPDAVAVIEWKGVCFPIQCRNQARRLAARLDGVPGVWLLKPRGLV